MNKKKLLEMEFPNEIESEDEERDIIEIDSRDMCLEYIRNALNSVPDNPSDDESDDDLGKREELKPESIQNNSQSSVVIFQQGID